jgi:hypothetical protein
MFASDLDAIIDAWRHRPLVYGSADCCQFIGECALAATGTDYRSAFPAYSSEAEALALISEYGDLVGLVTHAFGEPMHQSRARIGDPVVTVIGDRQVAGICLGVTVASPGPTGLVFTSMADAIAAWRL